MLGMAILHTCSVSRKQQQAISTCHSYKPLITRQAKVVAVAIIGADQIAARWVIALPCWFTTT